MAGNSRRLKEKHFSRIAACLRLSDRWRAVGNERWADYYKSEAARLRRQGVPGTIKTEPFGDYFIFYPNDDGTWSKYKGGYGSYPLETLGFMSEGMQGLIDGLLGKGKADFRQAA